MQYRKPVGFGTIVEDVAEVSTTPLAMRFGSGEDEAAVGLGADGIVQRLPETRPAGAAVEFCFRRELRHVATGAGERPFAFFMIERARSCRLDAVASQNIEFARVSAAFSTPPGSVTSNFSAASSVALSSRHATNAVPPASGASPICRRVSMCSLVESIRWEPAVGYTTNPHLRSQSRMPGDPEFALDGICVGYLQWQHSCRTRQARSTLPR